jgi:hypothetical protein
VHVDLEALKWGSSVQRDLRQARKLGVTGTPAYFINGRYLSGAKPIEVLREVIDKELELAAKLEAKGSRRTRSTRTRSPRGTARCSTQKPRKGLKPDVIYPVPVEGSPQRGPATGAGDDRRVRRLRVWFCARGHETLEKLRKRYGDKLRVVFKHFPLSFHGHAFLAARAAAGGRGGGQVLGVPRPAVRRRGRSSTRRR